jgi:hypothetical protein
MQRTMSFNAFTDLQMKSINDYVRNGGRRGSLLRKVFQIRGLIFKHVIYYNMGAEGFNGSIYG